MAGDEMVRPDLFPRRDDLRADLCAVLAARVEFAALRRVDRAGDIAFEDGELLRADGIRGRDRVEQCLGVRMDGVISSASASSTMLPRYMTPTRSEMYLTTDRSCVMNM